MTFRLLLPFAVLLALLSGCGSFATLSSSLDDDVASASVDTLFVTIDLPRDDRSYARKLATAFDSVFDARGVFAQSSAEANLALEDIPNLSLAREMSAPHLLVVRELGTASGRAAGDATHDATLYSTQSETRIWSMKGEMSGSGNAKADAVARSVYDALKTDGLLPDDE